MTKYLHASRNIRPGYFGSIALCGRMVNRLSITSAADEATCPRCIAAAAKQAEQSTR